ncbi:MAG: dUTP diphosphatase [Candidatus Aenigmarchaeota archaeon]|nr:dUTP diphosphatase [Candidatus Aenigmarchaeota archaeon]
MAEPIRESVIVKIELCHPEAKLPQYANPTDAGADIFSVEGVSWNPWETKILKTGLKVAIPGGWEIQMRPRSGLSAKTPLRMPNAPATIDSGYRNEVGVIMQNTSGEPFEIKKGDRIAQMVVARSPRIEWLKVDSVAECGGDRGGGFGSTGK